MYINDKNLPLMTGFYLMWEQQGLTRPEKSLQFSRLILI